MPISAPTYIVEEDLGGTDTHVIDVHVDEGQTIAYLIDAREVTHENRYMDPVNGPSLQVSSDVDGPLTLATARDWDDTRRHSASIWVLPDMTPGDHQITAAFPGTVGMKKIRVAVFQAYEVDLSDPVFDSGNRLFTGAVQTMPLTAGDGGWLIGARLGNSVSTAFSDYVPAEMDAVAGEPSVTDSEYSRVWWQGPTASGDAANGCTHPTSTGVGVSVSMREAASVPPPHTDVSGTAYPRDGRAATAESAEIAALDIAMTHEPTPAPPGWSKSAGVLVAAPGVGGTFRLGTSARRFATTPYHIACFTMAINRHGGRGSEPEGDSFPLFSLDSGGLRWNVIATAHGATTEPTTRKTWTGIGLHLDTAATGTELQFQNLATRPIIPFGEMIEYTFVVYRHASEGRLDVYVNGALAMQSTGHNTESYAELAGDDAWTFLLQGVDGWQYVLCPPFKTSGDLTNMTTFPKWDRQAPGQDVRLYAPPSWEAPDGTVGQHVIPDDWADVSHGYHPSQVRRGRHAVNAAVERTFALQYDVGSLEYGPKGHCSIAWLDFLPHGTEKFTFRVPDLAGTDLVSVSVNDASEVTDDVTNELLFTLPGDPAYYFAAIILHRSGTAAFHVQSLSARYGGGGSDRTLWTAPISRWTPQPIGRVACTINNTSAVNTPQLGGMFVSRIPWFSICDSLSATGQDVDGVDYSRANNMAMSFPSFEDATSVPNSNVRRRSDWIEIAGMEPKWHAAAMGRAGSRIIQLSDVADYRNVPVGCGLLSIESVINDLSPGGGDIDMRLVKQAFERVTRNCADFILATPIDRPTDGGSGWTTMPAWSDVDSALVKDIQEFLEQLATSRGGMIARVHQHEFDEDQSSNPQNAWTQPDNVHLDTTASPHDSHGQNRWFDAMLQGLARAGAKPNTPPHAKVSSG